MKTLTSPACHIAIAASLAFSAAVANSHAAPFISGPANGTVVTKPQVDVQIMATDITNIQSVSVKANGIVIGRAVPDTFFGEWSFPNGTHVSVLHGSDPGDIIVDYNPPNSAPMFWMDGTFTDTDTFTGTFGHWDDGNYTGNVRCDFSINTYGRMSVNIFGQLPLGNRSVSGGLSDTEIYSFKWLSPPNGTQRLVAAVTYLPDGATTPVTVNSPVITITVNVPNRPEIDIQQPKGTALVDGRATRSFGTARIGQTGAVKTFTIKNTGNARLLRLAVLKRGANPADFVVTGPDVTWLAPGASTTFKVAFKPRVHGTRGAVLQIGSNDANENPFDIRLTGMGSPP